MDNNIVNIWDIKQEENPPAFVENTESSFGELPDVEIQSNAPNADKNIISSEDADEYSKYGIQINSFNDRKLYDKARADKQGLGIELLNAGGQLANEIVIGSVTGLSNIIDQVYNFVSHDGYNDFTNPVSESLQEVKDNIDKHLEIYKENPEKTLDFTDSAYWTNGLVSVGSTLSMLLPTRGVMGVAGAAAKASRLNRVGRKLAIGLSKVASKTPVKLSSRAIGTGSRVLSDAIVMRSMESYQGAQDVYSDLYEPAKDYFSQINDEQKLNLFEAYPELKSDTSEEFANKLAGSTANDAYLENYWLTAFDIIQLRGLTNLYKTGSSFSRGLLKKNRASISAIAGGEGKESFLQSLGYGIKEGLGKNSALYSELSEAPEEMWNYYVGEKNKDRGRKIIDSNYDLRTLDSFANDPELWNSAIWGWLGGIGFQAGGQAIGAASTAVENAWNKYKNEKAGLPYREKVTAEKEAELEIEGRKAKLDRFLGRINQLEEGSNPYANLEDGTLVDPDKKDVYGDLDPTNDLDELRDAIVNDFVTELALSSYEAGTSELLDTYLSDNSFQQYLTKESAGVNADVISSVRNKINEVKDLYSQLFTDLDFKISNNDKIDNVNTDVLALISRGMVRATFKTNALQNLSNKYKEKVDKYISDFSKDKDFADNVQNIKSWVEVSNINDLLDLITDFRNTSDKSTFMRMATDKQFKGEINKLRKNSQLLSYWTDLNSDNNGTWDELSDSEIYKVSKDYISNLTKKLDTTILTDKKHESLKSLLQQEVKYRNKVEEESYLLNLDDQDSRDLYLQYSSLIDAAANRKLEKSYQAIKGKVFRDYENNPQILSDFVEGKDYLRKEFKQELDALNISSTNGLFWVNRLEEDLNKNVADREAAKRKNQQAAEVLEDVDRKIEEDNESEAAEVEEVVQEVEVYEADDYSTGDIEISEDGEMVLPDSINIDEVDHEASVSPQPDIELHSDSEKIELALIKYFRSQISLHDGADLIDLAKQLNIDVSRDLPLIITDLINLFEGERGFEIFNDSDLESKTFTIFRTNAPTALNRKYGTPTQQQIFEYFKETLSKTTKNYISDYNNGIRYSTSNLIHIMSNGGFAAIDQFLTEFTKILPSNKVKGKTKYVIDVDAILNELVFNDSITQQEAIVIYYNLSSYITNYNKNIKDSNSDKDVYIFKNVRQVADVKLFGNNKKELIRRSREQIEKIKKAKADYNAQYNNVHIGQAESFPKGLTLKEGEELTVRDSETGSGLVFSNKSGDIGVVAKTTKLADGNVYADQRATGLSYVVWEENGEYRTNFDDLFEEILSKSDIKIGDTGLSLSDILATYLHSDHKTGLGFGTKQDAEIAQALYKYLQDKKFEKSGRSGNLAQYSHLEPTVKSVEEFLTNIGKVVDYDNANIKNWARKVYNNYSQINKLQESSNNEMFVTISSVDNSSQILNKEAQSLGDDGAKLVGEKNPYCYLDKDGILRVENGQTLSPPEGMETHGTGFLITEGDRVKVAFTADSNKISNANEEFKDALRTHLTNLFGKLINADETNNYAELLDFIRNINKLFDVNENVSNAQSERLNRGDNLFQNIIFNYSDGVYKLFYKVGKKPYTLATITKEGKVVFANGSSDPLKAVDNTIEVVNNIIKHGNFKNLKTPAVELNFDNGVIKKDKNSFIIELGGKEFKYDNYSDFLIKNEAYTTKQGVDENGNHVSTNPSSIYINMKINGAPVATNSGEDSATPPVEKGKIPDRIKPYKRKGTNSFSTQGVISELFFDNGSVKDGSVELTEDSIKELIDAGVLPADFYYKDKSNGGVEGEFSTKSKKITLYSKAFKRSSLRNTLRILAHEQLHKHLDDNFRDSNGNSRFTPEVVEEIKDLYTQTIEYLRKAPSDPNVKEVFDRIKTKFPQFSVDAIEKSFPDFNSEDATKRQIEAEEWVVEAITSDMMREVLNNIPYNGDVDLTNVKNEKKSILQKIIDQILKLFGLNSENIKENSILAKQYMLLSDPIVSETNENKTDDNAEGNEAEDDFDNLDEDDGLDLLSEKNLLNTTDSTSGTISTTDMRDLPSVADLVTNGGVNIMC